MVREVPSNKGMKLTSVEHIGRSQLIPGVLLLLGWTTKKKPPRVWTRRDGSGIPRTGCAAPNVWTAVTGYGGRRTLVSKCIS